MSLKAQKWSIEELSLEVFIIKKKHLDTEYWLKQLYIYNKLFIG